MAELRTWTDRYGQAWECDAYDHGPLCRLCRKVEVCPTCQGRRVVRRRYRDRGKRRTQYVECPSCGGSGRIASGGVQVFFNPWAYTEKENNEFLRKGCEPIINFDPRMDREDNG